MTDPLLDLGIEKKFDDQILFCRVRFLQTTTDHGSAWRFFRQEIITERIHNRILTIRNDEARKGQVDLSKILLREFVDLVNDTITGLIQFRKQETKPTSLETWEAIELYEQEVPLLRKLMVKKFAEYCRTIGYGSTSPSALLLDKITPLYKGNLTDIEENYQDIVNYALLELHHMSEQ